MKKTILGIIIWWLLLVTRFAVAEYQSPIGDYDFSRDYRKEMAEERKQAIEKQRETLLAPIAGISLQQYANIQAQLAADKDDEATVLKTAKINPETWQQVTAGWDERLDQDETFLVREYRIYFLDSVPGRFANLGKTLSKNMRLNQLPQGEAPLSVEKWVEISKKITDSQNRSTILKEQGLTHADWAVISNWWGEQLRYRNPVFMQRYLQAIEKINK